jgi:hypothetical protein
MGKPRKVAEEHVDFDENGQQVYCLCKRVDDGTPMVFCSGCGIWFHCDCVGLSKRQADRLENWTCSSCVKAWETRREEKRNRRALKETVSSDTESEFDKPESEQEEDEVERIVKKPKLKRRRAPTPPLASTFPDDTENSVRTAVRKGFFSCIDALFKKTTEQVAAYLGNKQSAPESLLPKVYRSFYPKNPIGLANLLESYLFWSPGFHQWDTEVLDYQPTAIYKTQYRSLRTNLSDLQNTLLQKVLTGAIAAEKLYKLEAQDMARDDVRKVMEEVKLKSLKVHLLSLKLTFLGISQG